jgi:hypothetical protein
MRTLPDYLLVDLESLHFLERVKMARDYVVIFDLY